MANRQMRPNAALCFRGSPVPCVTPLFRPFTFTLTPMILPETFNHIENIKKRAGHLWRFL